MTKNRVPQEMPDVALDRLLRVASDPAVPEGAEARLMARLRQAEIGSNVVAMPVRRKAVDISWLTALPLAASLAAGIYLGASDIGAFYFPLLDSSTQIGALDGGLTTGVDEADNYAEEDLS
jgi:hypothetical protein